MFNQAKWNRERLGLGMITAALVVIGFILLLFFTYQQQSHTDQIHQQGTSLARSLAELPFKQLAVSDKRGVLDILSHTYRKDNFAYVVVAGDDGRPLNQMVEPGVLVSTLILPEKPVHWLGHRVIEATDSSASIIEFYAPLLEGSQLKGYIRLGYHQPQFFPSYNELSFAASLALPVFLLTALFYFLIRREMRPIVSAQQALNEQMASGDFKKIEIVADGEVGEFVRNINKYVNFSKRCIAEIESEQSTTITASRVLEYKFNKTEAMLQALPDGIIVMDNSGSTIFANDKARVFLETNPSVELGDPIKSWCGNSLMQSFIENCESHPGFAFGPDKIEQGEGEAKKVLSIHALPLFEGESHSTMGTVIVLRDGTKEYLAKQSRETFVAHIAHEFKTPLNTLSMYSESLLTGQIDDEKFRAEAVNVIHDETERMIGLINNMLSITKIEQGSLGIDRQRTKITDLLKDAVETIKHSSLKSGLTFDLKMQGDIEPISIDKNLMRVAINNLLTNAVKYNTPDGAVSVELEDAGERLLIHVRDTGIGISEEDQTKIFEQFYRSDDDKVRDSNGHGLGLALSKNIVQLHNGQLHVKSTLGKGSEFIIEIPKETERLKQVI